MLRLDSRAKRIVDPAQFILQEILHQAHVNACGHVAETTCVESAHVTHYHDWTHFRQTKLAVVHALEHSSARSCRVRKRIRSLLTTRAPSPPTFCIVVNGG